MLLKSTFASLLALVKAASAAAGGYLDNARIIEPRQTAKSYDYVVVGGGLAGSVIGARLSEIPDATVLVIEAGQLDKHEDFVMIPKNAMGAIGTDYDWNLQTVPMAGAGDRALGVPAGKVVGGSSVLNGMVLDRGAASDYDAWEELGNSGWGWRDLLPYFKKFETYTPPSPELAKEFNISLDVTSRGTSGPIQAAYPRYLDPTWKNWFRGLASIGIELERDSSNGRALNAMWAPNALHATEMVRSYARVGYHDKAITRKNFEILTGQQVTKIVGSGREVRFTAVEFSAGPDQPIQRVSVKREVIVSSGGLGTPKVLQLSGVGPAALLKKHNISVLIDLPVGYNLQDHSAVFSFNNLKNGPPTIDDETARQQYEVNKTGPWTISGPVGFAFMPLGKFSKRKAEILEAFKNQTPGQYLPTGAPEAVIRGYNKQKEILIKRLNTDLMSSTEFVYGAGGPFAGSVAMSLQHPFSRGHAEIVSANPFDTQSIDLGFLSNPVDVLPYIDALKWSRTVLQTPAMQELGPEEFLPGAEVTADEQIDDWTRNSVETFYHYSGTAPMQPRRLGGVVDTTGLVYGSVNLRVADASIIPLIPGTHIQSTVYALSEKIADAIKAARRRG